MKKLAVLIVLALAACVTYVALAGGGAEAGIRITHYKCYQARHAKRTPRFVPETVFLTDQFRDNVQVSVIKLSTHCSSAYQASGSAASEFTEGLDCYTVRDAPREPRFRPQNLDVEDKLSGGEQALTVSKVQSVCVPSFKFNPKSNLQGEAFVCYQAKRAKGQPRFEQRDVSIQDQFDDKDVRVIRPVAYCARADKKQDARNDDFNSLDNAGDITDEDLTINYHDSTVHATLESNDPPVSCKTPGYSNSVWYHWNSNLNLSLTVDTYGSSYDTVVAVFTGDKATLSQNEVACNDDAADSCSFGGSTAGCDETFSSLQFDAWADTDYHILVGSSDGHGGKLKFHVSRKQEDTSANSCNDPRSISSLYFSDHISTMNATFADGVAAGACGTISEDPNLSCTGPYGATVWYTYTPSSHQKVQFDTFGTSYPTVLAVFEPSSTAEVACASSSVNVVLKAGHKYLILVGSTDSDNNNRGGKLKFHASLIDKLSGGSQAAGVEIQVSGFDSITCYQVRQARHQTQTDEVWDQFSIRQLPFGKGPSPWTLSIGGVDSVCVPSNKHNCTRYVETTGIEGDAASLCYIGH